MVPPRAAQRIRRVGWGRCGKGLCVVIWDGLGAESVCLEGWVGLREEERGRTGYGRGDVGRGKGKMGREWKGENGRGSEKGEMGGGEGKRCEGTKGSLKRGTGEGNMDRGKGEGRGKERGTVCGRKAVGGKEGMEVYLTRTVQCCGGNSARTEDMLWFRGHPCRQLYEIKSIQSSIRP